MNEQRVELWGFAVGDRVRVKNIYTPDDEGVRGLMGYVTWVGGCSVANESRWCRLFCRNVQFEQYDAPGEKHLVPPAYLEHID